MTQKTVSGLSIRDGWEERAEELCNMAQVRAWLSLSAAAKEQLSEEEIDRTMLKFQMLVPFVKQLMVGMLKGTLKYETDIHSLEEYQREIADELGDYVNYVLLTQQGMFTNGRSKD